jgi:hypothetical protein
MNMAWHADPIRRPNFLAARMFFFTSVSALQSVARKRDLQQPNSRLIARFNEAKAEKLMSSLNSAGADLLIKQSMEANPKRANSIFQRARSLSMPAAPHGIERASTYIALEGVDGRLIQASDEIIQAPPTSVPVCPTSSTPQVPSASDAPGLEIDPVAIDAEQSRVTPHDSTQVTGLAPRPPPPLPPILQPRASDVSAAIKQMSSLLLKVSLGSSSHVQVLQPCRRCRHPVAETSNESGDSTISQQLFVGTSCQIRLKWHSARECVLCSLNTSNFQSWRSTHLQRMITPHVPLSS